MNTKLRLLCAAMVLLAGAVYTTPTAAQSTQDAEVSQPDTAPPAEDNVGADDYAGADQGLNPAEIAALNGAGGGDGEAFLSEDGFVWHSSGASDATYPGDGSSTWRYNPTGEDIVVDRTDVGVYNVSFGTSTNFIPTVTAYGVSGNHCNLGSFSYPGNTFRVECYNSAGDPIDEEFSARWTVTADDAALWVSDAGGTCCDTNPWGGAQSVTKGGTGAYAVTTPGGPNFEGGHIQVTAYGFNQADSCKVVSWSGTVTNVACYDSSGAAVDSNFTFLRIGSEDDAYAWADDASSTTTYTTDTFWSHNPQGNNPTSIKNSTGFYTVTFPGLLRSYGGNVVVTAYGSGSAKCSISSWATDTANVSCTTASGAPVDSQFDVLYTRFQTCQGVPANIEIGNNSPTNGADVIVGTSGADSIFALGGDDLVCGGGGDDFIVGASGDDEIYGEAGDDTISGNQGDDLIYTGAGDDTSFAGSGNDIVYGGSGEDLLGGSSGFDQIFGEADDDRINGGSDADGLVDGGSGDDAVNGGSGDDVQVTGGLGNDSVSGNGGDDIITGAAGQDDVRGGPGDDTVFGGTDNDFVAGNDGFDTCDGQSGVDTAASNCEVLISIP